MASIGAGGHPAQIDQAFGFQLLGFLGQASRRQQ